MTPTPHRQAQLNLESLLAEKTEVQTKIKEAQDALKALESRLSELNGSYYNRGEITTAKLAVRDSAFPILIVARDADYLSRNQRIIAVSPRTITLREDGADEDKVTRYSRETGKPPNSKYHSGIDVAKALTIWENHLAAQEQSVAVH